MGSTLTRAAAGWLPVLLVAADALVPALRLPVLAVVLAVVVVALARRPGRPTGVVVAWIAALPIAVSLAVGLLPDPRVADPGSCDDLLAAAGRPARRAGRRRPRHGGPPRGSPGRPSLAGLRDAARPSRRRCSRRVCPLLVPVGARRRAPPRRALLRGGAAWASRRRRPSSPACGPGHRERDAGGDGLPRSGCSAGARRRSGAPARSSPRRSSSGRAHLGSGRRAPAAPLLWRAWSLPGSSPGSSRTGRARCCSRSPPTWRSTSRSPWRSPAGSPEPPARRTSPGPRTGSPLPPGDHVPRSVTDRRTGPGTRYARPVPTRRSSRETSMKVADVMTRNVVAVRPGDAAQGRCRAAWSSGGSAACRSWTPPAPSSASSPRPTSSSRSGASRGSATACLARVFGESRQTRAGAGQDRGDDGGRGDDQPRR